MSHITPSRRSPTDTLPELSQSEKYAFQGRTLKPFLGNPEPPSISLESLYGGIKSLNEYRDQVVLLNFWATWCKPCVEEIPSISRLVKRLEGRPFKVVTINIGESQEHIQEFVKDLQVNFEILLDRESESVRNWNIYAYPSNFLLDKTGKITHAYRGALAWDSPVVVEVIESML